MGPGSNPARADLLRRMGAGVEATKSYTRALALVTNESERRFLERRLREVNLPSGENLQVGKVGLPPLKIRSDSTFN